MVYSNNPVYEYNISIHDMDICMNLVKDSIDNNMPIHLSRNSKFKERTRFMLDFYNVLNDFKKSGINPSIKKVSI